MMRTTHRLSSCVRYLGVSGNAEEQRIAIGGTAYNWLVLYRDGYVEADMTASNLYETSSRLPPIGSMRSWQAD